MNQQNLEYLKDNVKYLGFGEALNDSLEKNMIQGKDSFSLEYKTEINQKSFEATLNFRKSDNSDMYFLNNYKASLNNGPDQHVCQTFFLNKGKGITCKEAFNLLEGRAVNKDLTNKEGQLYNAWIQLDFKQIDARGNFQVNQYHHNYGYNLEKELRAHPIKELGNEQEKTRLVQSLQKGNRQSVTFKEHDNEQKMFLEANPRFKTLNVYDSKMQRTNSQVQRETKGQQQPGAKQDKNEKVEQGDEEDNTAGKNSKKRRTKRQGIS
ncbi:hypothetical protein EXU57_24220 [Segetibacter sp. 3557_3]|uniref:hypothetical protein n=1 Tax=Segetibacter sp. 3557_3 TaxID=2547429 RepID=UPI001058ED0B|nr:hypothetical protein [Segetibacter sp. 3557_3]TDH18160.1 hypothetical protein EXU57_24220 [Segetibacter sp. 3557_3]